MFGFDFDKIVTTTRKHPEKFGSFSPKFSILKRTNSSFQEQWFQQIVKSLASVHLCST